MIVLLTEPQLLLLARAKKFFEDRLVNENLRSMFRGEPDGLSVGLAFSEHGQHFIVRQTIECVWTDAEVDAALSRLILHLAGSISKVRFGTQAA